MKKLIIYITILISFVAFGQNEKAMFFKNQSDPALKDFVFEVYIASDGGTYKVPFRGGLFNANVYWGDGNSDLGITTASDAAATHTYTTAGTYEIRINGSKFTGIDGASNTTADRLKPVNFKQWGTLLASGNVVNFRYFKNMVYSATDVPPIPMDMTQMFRDCDALGSISNIADWDFSYGIINTMFYQAAVNIDVSGCDFSAITSATLFMSQTLFSTTNYNALLISLAGQSLQSSVPFNVGTTKYTQTSVDSGTTDGTATNKLIQSGQNFTSTISIGDIIRNTTDNTFAEVTAIDSDTQLSLDNDIMVSGEAFVVQSSAAAKARYVLINTYSWTITDGGAI